MYLTSLVTTRIGIELAATQRKLPDCVVIGLQLYWAWTFHVTLSLRIYKGGQGPPRKTSIPKAIQTTTQDVRYYATRSPNLSKSLCFLHHCWYFLTLTEESASARNIAAVFYLGVFRSVIYIFIGKAAANVCR